MTKVVAGVHGHGKKIEVFERCKKENLDLCGLNRDIAPKEQLGYFSKIFMRLVNRYLVRRRVGSQGLACQRVDIEVASRMR
jgi:hypothetical protein